MNRITLSILGACATVMAAHAQHSIEDLAPSSSFMVVGTKNMGQTVDKFKSGHVWQTLHSADMHDVVGAHFEQMTMMVQMMEQELGLDPGTLDVPSGPVGLAFFSTMDDDLGVDTLGLMFTAEFSDHRATLEAAIDKMLEEAEMAGQTIDDKEIAGVTFHAMKLNLNLPGDAAGGGMGGIGPDPAALMSMMTAGMKHLYIGQVGDSLVAGTSVPALADAVSALKGDQIESIGSMDAYRDAIAQVGGGDVHAVLIPAAAATVAAADPQMMFMLPMLAMPLNMLGLDNIRAFSLAADVGETGVIVSQKMGVLMEGEKRGILGLMNTGTVRSTVPAFVSAESTGYSHYNFEFDGVMGLINSIVRIIPPEFAPQVEQFMMDYGPDLQGAFSSLGQDVHVVQMKNSQMLVAIACKDTNRFVTILNKYAPMAGLQPREFVGQTLFSDDFTPVSVGVGGGHVFIGESASVEDAMRTSGQQGLQTISDTSLFRLAMSHLQDGKVVAWGFSDTAATIESAIALQRMQGAAAFGGEMPPMPDPEFIKKFVGPSVWTMESVPDGFVFRSMTLEPQTQ